jgi:hypothetical protein
MSCSDDVSAREITDRALKRQQFVRRFRELRAETLEYRSESGKGDLADEDVFRIVS